MKAIFTKAQPNPGEVVSAIEIDVGIGVTTLPAANGIGCWVGIMGETAHRVLETQLEAEQIIMATRRKSTQPAAATDDNTQDGTNGNF